MHATGPARRVAMEPLMFVKVYAAREHIEWVIGELRRRGARMHEVELQREQAVIRAEIRRVALPGLEQWLREHTTNSARLFSWLVRYEPVEATVVPDVEYEG
jgi:translation elongation factor EF-G